jgi:hypothetical protein
VSIKEDDVPRENEVPEFAPGDIYEDAFYHPCLCVGASMKEDEVWGISLLDGSYPRSCSITYSHPRKLSVAEAWGIKKKMQHIP